MKSGNLESEVPPSGKGDGSTGWGTAEAEGRRGCRRDQKGPVNHAVELGLYLKDTGYCKRVSYRGIT